jgi:hypothetical protein
VRFSTDVKLSAADHGEHLRIGRRRTLLRRWPDPIDGLLTILARPQELAPGGRQLALVNGRTGNVADRWHNERARFAGHHEQPEMVLVGMVAEIRPNEPRAPRGLAHGDPNLAIEAAVGALLEPLLFGLLTHDCHKEAMANAR